MKMDLRHVNFEIEVTKTKLRDVHEGHELYVLEERLKKLKKTRQAILHEMRMEEIDKNRLPKNPNQYIWGGEVRDKRTRSMTARPFFKY